MMPELETHPPSTDILDAALEYVDMGLSVIPVRRRDKKPYLKWEPFQQRRATREEVESWWERWPGANVAIVCGQVSNLFCVDADGPAGQDWIDANLPRTGVYSVTSKGVHALFRPPQNSVIRNRVRLAPEVDIRGEGGYFVAPPSVHESGHKYEWRFIMEGWDDLAEFQPADPHKESCGKCQEGNLGIELSGSKESVTLLLPGVAEGGRNDALARLMGRWACNPHLSLEECRMLAESWNLRNTPPIGKAPGDDPKSFERTILSIWNRERTKRESAASILIPCEKEKDRTFPEHLLRPGGLLQDLMEYIDSNSPVSVQPFNLAASLAFVGALVGQKIMTGSGLRTNLMCISLGYSGVGKNAPHNALSELLIRSNAAPVMGPTTVTSDASILRRLSEPGLEVTLMLLDEFGHVLKGIKKPLSVEAKIPALLTKLFSGTARGESKEYATGERLVVVWHHVSLYATSTPGRFWEDLSPQDFADGFLARANIFETQEGAKDPRPVISVTPPESLIQSVNELCGIEFEWEPVQGNIAGAIHRRPVPRKIVKSAKARAIFEPWRKMNQDRQNMVRKAEDGVSAVYGRTAEHASKIALIHHVSLHGTSALERKVDEGSVRWAMDLVDFLTAGTIRQMKEHLAENPFDRLQKRVIRYITGAFSPARPGVSARDLRCDMKLKKKEFDELLHSMEAAGHIVIDPEWKPKRGPSPAGGLICLAKPEAKPEET